MRVIEQVTNANGGVRPSGWEPYYCCSTNLCNSAGRTSPLWGLLMLALVAAVWGASANCEPCDLTISSARFPGQVGEKNAMP